MPDDRMPGESVISLDARQLRGLAHPLRVRILEFLELDGPATATILADRLGVKTGSTSWHLLKLAESGLVEEVPDRGNRRDRWWRAAHAGWTFDPSELGDDPDLDDASATVLSAVMSQHLLRAARVLDQDWPPAWGRCLILYEEVLRLDPEGLAALGADICAVIDRYKSQPGSDDGAPDTERVMFQMQAFPYRPADRP